MIPAKLRVKRPSEASRVSALERQFDRMQLELRALRRELERLQTPGGRAPGRLYLGYDTPGSIHPNGRRRC